MTGVLVLIYSCLLAVHYLWQGTAPQLLAINLSGDWALMLDFFSLSSMRCLLPRPWQLHSRHCSIVMCASSVHTLVVLTFLLSEIIELSNEMLNWHDTSLLASCCNQADVDNAAVACLLVLGPEPAPCGAFSEFCCSIARNNVQLHEAQHIHKKEQASNKSDKQWNHKSTSIFCQNSLLSYLCRDSLHDLIYV
jgi:hypothetical protein